LSPKSNKETKSRAGLAVSAIAHVAVLGWGLVTFGPSAFEPRPTDSMPIDLVPISEVTQLQKGNRTAPKQEQPKQAAEKVADFKPAPEVKKANTPESKTAAAPPPPPPPPQESKPERDAKKEEVKPEAKPEVAVPTPPKKQPPKPKTPDSAQAYTPSKQRDFNTDQIAALLDRRQPQQRAAERISPTGALGASSGSAPQLSISELEALRRKVEQCWNVLPGVGNSERVIVELRVLFKEDGTLAATPKVLNPQNVPGFQAVADSAIRAVIQCQPYKMLSPAKYDVWKDIEMGFIPPGADRG
jgi:colicin import membrane protein